MKLIEYFTDQVSSFEIEQNIDLKNQQLIDFMLCLVEKKSAPR